jgi:hypothetical protein
MLRRLSIFLAAGSLILAISGATAFAGDKAGATNVTSSSTCDETTLLQDNQFSGEIYIFLHDPSASGDTVIVTYHKSGDSFTTYLTDYICQWDGWFLYDSGQATVQAGATSVAVYDEDTGVKIGGDSFLSTFVPV